MPFDYERAVAFIFAHGSDIELHALNGLEGGDRPDAPSSNEVEWQLLEGQRADGGWAPFWAADYGSLDATCYRLAHAEMAQLSLPQGSLEFLQSRQRPDGTWEEDEAVRGLAPPWAKPGDLAARLYLTANCGCWLINGMIYGAQGYEDEAARVGAYLERYQAEDGTLPRFCRPTGSPRRPGFAWSGVGRIYPNRPSAHWIISPRGSTTRRLPARSAGC